MSPRELATLADRAGADLARAAAILARVDPGARALPGAVPGRLGDLARAMQGQLTAALAARSREAAAHAARYADAAAVLRLVACGYSDADAEAQRRQEGGGG